MKKYRYFIAFIANGGTAYGNTFFEDEINVGDLSPDDATKWSRSIQNWLKEVNHYSDVVLINIELLN